MALQPEELKAIEARCEAAAAGPWTMRDSVWDGSWAVEGPRGFDQRREPFHLLIDDHYDAAFIAHARTDIPRLIATIEEARREQPVRVTDADYEREAEEYTAACDTTAHITEHWLAGHAAGYLAAARKSLALAAAPKEGTAEDDRAERN